MPKKNNLLRITGDAHIAFNILKKEEETSFFYHGSDTNIAMMLALAAHADKRFARILDMASRITIEIQP
ncbi:MAG: hypothetical protein IKW35_08570 [Paludibacteraceae bacterium]|nr:hypothetical protein [Paludibacteraceae bacterium]